ncbi:MAG: hypothetical protein ATN34_04245 [Epulopiscium sp. Nele67-Bin002]|nr:MAG: hypothetical protein ATN34_04245 [Epulopiscium sp. Nele67-Bin002]OON90811.1 MAG: hypothetical protein ATN33_02210 [Epulopiscium sp. Nele67-Bin001]
MIDEFITKTELLYCLQNIKSSLNDRFSPNIEYRNMIYTNQWDKLVKLRADTVALEIIKYYWLINDIHNHTTKSAIEHIFSHCNPKLWSLAIQDAPDLNPLIYPIYFNHADVALCEQMLSQAYIRNVHYNKTRKVCLSKVLDNATTASELSYKLMTLPNINHLDIKAYFKSIHLKRSREFLRELASLIIMDTASCTYDEFKSWCSILVRLNEPAFDAALDYILSHNNKHLIQVIIYPNAHYNLPKIIQTIQSVDSSTKQLFISHIRSIKCAVTKAELIHYMLTYEHLTSSQTKFLNNCDNLIVFDKKVILNNLLCERHLSLGKLHFLIYEYMKINDPDLSEFYNHIHNYNVQNWLLQLLQLQPRQRSFNHTLHKLIEHIRINHDNSLDIKLADTIRNNAMIFSKSKQLIQHYNFNLFKDIYGR